MISTATAVRTLQAVALSVGIAVFLWGTGLPAFFQVAEAAALTNASDTLSSSAPGGSSVHTIQFTTPNGMAAGEVFAITFPDLFTNITNLTLSDITLSVNGDATTTQSSNGADIWGVATGTHFIAFTSPNDEPVASTSSFVITIGDELQNMITNPSATSSYAIGIGTDSATTTIQDSGEVRVAIIDEVTVSASVPTTLEFSVSGVGSGATVNSSPTTTAAGTTNTTLPFGQLADGTSKTLAQDLSVTTNAVNGASVTVVTSGDLQSSTGAIIDGFVDGNYTGTPTAWTAPSADAGDLRTWGHWALTSEDSNITGSDLWISPSTTPVTVFDFGTSAVGTTTRVGYQVEISGLQEAGTDYSTTLRYIATPVF